MDFCASVVSIKNGADVAQQWVSPLVIVLFNPSALLPSSLLHT